MDGAGGGGPGAPQVSGTMWLGRRLEELPTPALAVSEATARRNAERMRERCRALGVRLRPHVKTHKTLEGAALATGGTRRGIAVSTLAEARFFAAAGFDDILYAYPLPGGRLEECAALAERLDAFQVLLDSPAGLARLRQRPLAAGKRWLAWLKLDCGNGRAGVQPTDPGALELARAIAEEAPTEVELVGVYAHCGNTYRCSSVPEIQAIARATTAAVLDFVAKQVRHIWPEPGTSGGRRAGKDGAGPGLVQHSSGPRQPAGSAARSPGSAAMLGGGYGPPKPRLVPRPEPPAVPAPRTSVVPAPRTPASPAPCCWGTRTPSQVLGAKPMQQGPLTLAVPAPQAQRFPRPRPRHFPHPDPSSSHAPPRGDQDPVGAERPPNPGPCGQTDAAGSPNPGGSCALALVAPAPRPQWFPYPDPSSSHTPTLAVPTHQPWWFPHPKPGGSCTLNLVVPTHQPWWFLHPNPGGSHTPTLVVPAPQPQQLPHPNPGGSRTPNLVVPAPQPWWFLHPEPGATHTPTLVVPVPQPWWFPHPNPGGSRTPNLVVPTPQPWWFLQSDPGSSRTPTLVVPAPQPWWFPYPEPGGSRTPNPAVPAP
ncbi:uncharacterized protein [Struthio camelus]|uniref:uncharacterized protein isoform X1 n=1 Tax=Struthio camelus TaxID=8801 RepID=UPI003603E15B